MEQILKDRISTAADAVGGSAVGAIGALGAVVVGALGVGALGAVGAVSALGAVVGGGALGALALGAVGALALGAVVGGAVGGNVDRKKHKISQLFGVAVGLGLPLTAGYVAYQHELNNPKPIVSPPIAHDARLNFKCASSENKPVITKNPDGSRTVFVPKSCVPK